MVLIAHGMEHSLIVPNSLESDALQLGTTFHSHCRKIEAGFDEYLVTVCRGDWRIRQHTSYSRQGY